jgi:hypothetical protein
MPRAPIPDLYPASVDQPQVGSPRAPLRAHPFLLVWRLDTRTRMARMGREQREPSSAKEPPFRSLGELEVVDCGVRHKVRRGLPQDRRLGAGLLVPCPPVTVDPLFTSISSFLSGVLKQPGA